VDERDTTRAAGRKPGPVPANENSNIENVIAVMSGKGGVGKSSVAALVASGLAKAGKSVGILDADITGPSIPRMFGISERPGSVNGGIEPIRTRKLGIPVMSLNLLLEHEDDPVIWRGPLISNTVKQFWTDVNWGNLDYLVVDLPPGSSDSPLTVMQSVPLTGVIIVTSPQDLVFMVVRKAIKMAGMMNVPVLGLVENMSYVTCPGCGEKIRIFGETNNRQVAEESGIRFLGELPIDPALSDVCDQGRIEDYDRAAVNAILENLSKEGK